MAITRMSNLVFVGGAFPVELFDERTLFDGDLDQGGQVKIGPLGQFSYSSGIYRFEVTPPRIDLKHNGLCIVPDALIKAGSTVASIIEPTRGAIKVSGFGINCDTVFDRESIGTSGIEFCSRLINQRFTKLVGAVPVETMGRISFYDGAVRYQVQFVPDANSQGENLLMAVNGHQNVTNNERLDSILDLERIQVFRTYILGLHRRIIATARSA